MSRFRLPSGQIVQGETPVTIGDVQYLLGVRMLAVAERNALGIAEIVEQPMPDPRFFSSTEDPANPGSWLSTPRDPAVIKAELMAHSAMRRWEKEIGGTTVGTMKVPTDERTQAVVTGARLEAMADPTYTIPDWKIGPGQYMTLNAATIIAIAEAVRAHVQACFTLNNQVDAKIAAGTITTYEDIDAAYA